MKRQRSQKKLQLDHAAIRELKDHDFVRADGGVPSDAPPSPLSFNTALASRPNC